MKKGGEAASKGKQGAGRQTGHRLLDESDPISQDGLAKAICAAPPDIKFLMRWREEKNGE